jgi:hypothetical protein
MAPASVARGNNTANAVAHTVAAVIALPIRRRMPPFKHSFSDQKRASLKRQEYVEFAWITDCQNLQICFRRALFSSDMDHGPREENASKQQSRASLLIQSEAKML